MKVVFVVEGKEVIGEVCGNGLVDVMFNVIEGEVGSGFELLLYLVNVIMIGM